jgi:hypothetical protein
MELSKYPLDKLLLFVAAILPGSIALLIFQLAHPHSFDWFLDLGFLGYKTRFGLILLACFVIGYSITTFLNRLLGAIGGAVGGFIATRIADRSLTVAPWRNPQWRSLVKIQLGAHAPNDTQLMSAVLFDLRRQLIEHLPENEREMALIELQQERLTLEVEDSRWEEWYEHYHQTILLPAERDFMWHVENGLNLNLESASICVLVGALFVPSVRHWWCMLPACIWVFLLVNEVYWMLKNFLNPWSTLSAQLRYLAEIGRGQTTPN